MTKEQRQKHNIRMLENIYDLTKIKPYKDTDRDTFAELTLKHGKASQELKTLYKKQGNGNRSRQWSINYRPTL